MYSIQNIHNYEYLENQIHFWAALNETLEDVINNCDIRHKIQFYSIEITVAWTYETLMHFYVKGAGGGGRRGGL
jgi:hypothetical protein